MFDENKLHIHWYTHSIFHSFYFTTLKEVKSIPYAEYEDNTMMYAEALLIEYHKGAVLCDAL